MNCDPSVYQRNKLIVNVRVIESFHKWKERWHWINWRSLIVRLFAKSTGVYTYVFLFSFFFFFLPKGLSRGAWKIVAKTSLLEIKYSHSLAILLRLLKQVKFLNNRVYQPREDCNWCCFSLLICIIRLSQLRVFRMVFTRLQVKYRLKFHTRSPPLYICIWHLLNSTRSVTSENTFRWLTTFQPFRRHVFF